MMQRLAQALCCNKILGIRMDLDIFLVLQERRTLEEVTCDKIQLLFAAVGVHKIISRKQCLLNV